MFTFSRPFYPLRLVGEGSRDQVVLVRVSGGQVSNVYSFRFEGNDDPEVSGRGSAIAVTLESALYEAQSSFHAMVGSGVPNCVV